MPDTTPIREQLKAFDFNKLFIQELGWDRHTSHLEVPVENQVFSLVSVAKRRKISRLLWSEPLRDESITV